MRSNVEQYIILLESRVTPEHVKQPIREALLILGDVVDVLNEDPLVGGFANISKELPKEEVKEIVKGTFTEEEGEPTGAYVMQDPDLKKAVLDPE
jgi:hypothetical protein|tara:strand:- start:835 stop:1119 length:285 start_codon:yes stop_codon:yes gene_type:complete